MKTSIILLLSVMSNATYAADLTSIVNKLDSECAGNDNGYVGKFNPAKFNASKVMRELRKSSGNDCTHNLSRNQDEGVTNLLYVLFNSGSDESECVMGALTKTEQKILRNAITDPTNLGVFSKEWDRDSGDSEYCLYANYDIYRADGTLISIVFNHTD